MKSVATQLAMTTTGAALFLGIAGVNSAHAVSIWKFNDTVGSTTAYNSLGTIVNNSIVSNNGTYNNTTASGTGILTLNGVDQSVTVANDSDLNVGTGNLLIAARLLTGVNNSNVQTIVDKRVSTSGLVQGYHLYLQNGKIGFQLSSGGVQRDFISTPVIADNQFHNIVVSLNRASSTGLQLFIDGTSVNTFNPTAIRGSLDVTKNLTIGQRSDNPSSPGYFNGQIDSVCISKSLIQSSCTSNIALTSFSTKPQTFVNKIFDVESRVGSNSTYEHAIGYNGAQSDNTGTIDRNWKNDVPVNWVINWDPVTNTATYELTNPTGQTISYTFVPGLGQLDIFNGFGLLAKSYDEANKVSPGTTSAIKVTEMTVALNDGSFVRDTDFVVTPNAINPGLNTLNVSVTAGSAEELKQYFYGFNNPLYQEIRQIKGTTTMAWPTGGLNPVTTSANSRITTKFTAFDPPPTQELASTPNGAPSVPEPSLVLGLLAVTIASKAATLKQ